ncbi:PAS domain-containing sensor histidine kinase [Caulobacter sp. UNC279MFTsu5.1]|uniref:sensor histidine kinase n=1 Tax=Caulobacter sp. UNC279MFTsu5.1 TaxID=1502775 RepID=UPI00036271E0|nr:HAMP domain-containing sensor histidine kinase [Caulobacter sp. UNC279MFTsu5.1]SFK71205.1 Signal transduction histidine kinase [Caulobacter sp. UNC279MFTsu5.1]
MASSGRALNISAALLMTGAALFAVNAAQQQLWANAAIGLATFCGSLVALWGAVSRRTAILQAPSTAPPNAADDLRILVDQAPIPLVRFSDAHGIQAVNRAARALFQTDDVILDGAIELTEAICWRGGDLRPSLQVFGRHYAVNISELTIDEGPIRLAALTDVEAEINRAEAAALRDTLQILSHEIMNSLTPIASLADVASSYIEPGAAPDLYSARLALETLSRRTASLTRFIDAYHSMARLPEPVFQSVDVTQLVVDIVEFFRRSPLCRDVELCFDATADIPRLRLDEAQVGQALINVITNALEATENQLERRVSVSVRQSRRNVIISISDNGGGIDEAVRANLFTAFATTKEKGGGIGLNLARQISLAQGGNLQLLEDPGEAMTVFAFTFPAPGGMVT